MKVRLGLLFLSTALAGVMTIFIAGCNQPQETTGTPPPSTTVGTEIDDSVVTARVKSALLADPDVKSFGFKVDTRKGEVQLSGFVDNRSQIDRAIEVAGGIAGARSVSNEMSIKK